MTNIYTLLRTKKTVFTIQDVMNILQCSYNTARVTLQREVKQGRLQRLYAGIVGLSDFSHEEFAIKLRQKSYISCEIVLQKAGVIYQDYSHTITLVSNNTLSKRIGNIDYRWQKIRESILLNPLGIEHKNHISIACPERALCDCVYLSPGPGLYFDFIEALNFEKLTLIAQIYPSRVQKTISSLISHARSIHT